MWERAESRPKCRVHLLLEGFNNGNNKNNITLPEFACE
jgi:hypothetical protein